MTDPKRPEAKAPADNTVGPLPLDTTTVSGSAPEGAGVVTLLDNAGEALKVEYAPNIREVLNGYATKGPLQPEVVRLAARFAYVLTDDAGLVAKLFDKIVNETGSFPLCQPEAPVGSRYQGQQDPKPTAAVELDALVTRYDQFTDTELLDRIRESLEKDPGSIDLQETYAFLLYSSGSLDDAIERYEFLAGSENAKAIHHFYLGNAYYKKKRIPDAIDQWSQVVEKSPRSRAGLKAARRRRKAKELVGSAA